MNWLALAAVLPLFWFAPAAAREAVPQAGRNVPCMSGMTMPGCTPAPAPKQKATPRGEPAAPKTAAPAEPHRGEVAPCMAGMIMPGCNPVPVTRDLPATGDVGNPPPVADTHIGPDTSIQGRTMPEAGALKLAIPHRQPPPAPIDHLADRFYDPVAMAAARRQLSAEHGGGVYSKVMADLLEHQARSGGDGYRWEGEAWYGGDIARLVAKTEGQGSRRDGLEAAELQALYSRAMGRYFDLQAGVRQDFRPRNRTYLTVGAEGLLPYWFHIQTAVFLSTKGEVLGRLEGTYDLRLAQRLILQPRAELNISAQTSREMSTGSGLSDAELGLRLRYEIRREFAPYVGVSFERKLGGTAAFAHAAGGAVRSTSFVAGVRAWF